MEVQLLPVLASCSSSLEKFLSLEAISHLPNDYKTYQELLKSVALDLGIQIKEVRASSHHLTDILSMTGPPSVLLPINEVILEPMKTRWQTPSSLSCTSKHAEQKYHVSSQEFDYLLFPLISRIACCYSG